jgi:hypothetical protein
MNTEYEHAGNSDQLRAMQFDSSARCELCHFPQGYEHSEGRIVLGVVQLPAAGGTRPGLLCQHCIVICNELKDTNFQVAASLIRPLPPETLPANQALLEKLVRASDDALLAEPH